MPPLAVIGFGLATFNWTVFSGALMLYVTNLMTIALTATIMARLYGFRTNLSERQTTYQTFLIVIAFVALAIPLSFTLRQIAWEANATRQISSTVLDAFDDRARIQQLESGLKSDPIVVSAIVLTPQLEDDAEQRVARALTRSLNRDVEVSLTQSRTGANAQAAEQAQLTAALASQQAASEQAQDVAERLALVAGVTTDDLIVDRDRRRATVNARPLEGATLAAYFDLESRIAASEDEAWDIRLVPPVRALPDISFDGEEISSAGQEALGLAEWAISRINLPVELSGPAGSVEAVRLALAERGIEAAMQNGGEGYGDVSLDWVTQAE